jgi:glyceraldehyde-3-phosphate dehydrogenase (ferredoxin)
MRVLFIGVGNKTFGVEEIEREDILGPLDLGVYLHKDVYKSYEKDVYDPSNVVIVGTGPLNYPGAQRGVIVFRSPIHGGIHSSVIGDLGEYLKRAGYDAIVIEGKAETETLIFIYDSEIDFYEESLPENIFEKEKELYERFSNYKNIRALLTGKAAVTDYACLVSSKPGRIGEIPCVAGRGGAGSVLYKAHNVVGLVVGGSKDISIQEYDVKKILESTKKYRESGTFYANYPHLKDKIVALNWQISCQNKEKRLEFYEKFVEGVLLKDYTFSSDTCGERCPVACKKIEDGVKLDYEPVNGLGPFIGIFDREKIRELVHLADSYGFDAIYLGHVLGTLMEALSKGLLDIDVEKPVLEFDKYEKDFSETNYKVAKKLIEKLISGELPGSRIRKLAERLGIKDLAFYVPIGSEYDMTPNFYWTLGLILPIAMFGKYYSDYHTTVKDPEEYAKICAERTVMEYLLDNLGICRFHRAWVESEIISDTQKEIAKKRIKDLLEYRKLAGAEPIFWESKRVLDVVTKLFEEGGSEWANKVEEYWNKWKEAYNSFFFD